VEEGPSPAPPSPGAFDAWPRPSVAAFVARSIRELNRIFMVRCDPLIMDVGEFLLVTLRQWADCTPATPPGQAQRND
jgi:hypothetical protein